MPVADPPPTELQIPCGHCGFVVALPIARLPDDGRIVCPDCTQPILLYLAGLREDIVAATSALARLRGAPSPEAPD